MAQVFWRELYCFRCEKNTKHRYSQKNGSKIDDNLFDNPQIEWECWSCKSKKIKTINKNERVFLTLKTRKWTEKEAQKNPQKYLLESLAKVVYFLENRIIELEKLLASEQGRRGIKIIEDKD